MRGAIVIAGHRGLNRVSFSGRISGRALPAGLYALEPRIGKAVPARRPTGILVAVSRRRAVPARRTTRMVNWTCGTSSSSSAGSPAAGRASPSATDGTAANGSSASEPASSAGQLATVYGGVKRRFVAEAQAPFQRRLLRLEDPSSPVTILVLALFGLATMLLVGARVRGSARSYEDGVVAAPPWRSAMSSAGLLALLVAVTMLVLIRLPGF